MDEPKTILEKGTRIRTSKILGSSNGMCVRLEYIDNRRKDALGIIGGVVGGHGGDVYWVEHDDGKMAVYGWMEFDLEDPPARSIYDRLLEEEPLL
jgi:hypothetical protein